MDSRDVSLTERVRGVGGRKLRGGHRARPHAPCAAGRARCVACASAARLSRSSTRRRRRSVLERNLAICSGRFARLRLARRQPRARGLAVHVARTLNSDRKDETRFNACQSRDTLAVPRREVPRITIVAYNS